MPTLSLLIKSHAAKEESDTKSKRVTSGKRKGMVEVIYQGWNAPYGYRAAGEQAHNRRSIEVYQPDPDAGAHRAGDLRSLPRRRHTPGDRGRADATGH